MNREEKVNSTRSSHEYVQINAIQRLPDKPQTNLSKRKMHMVQIKQMVDGINDPNSELFYIEYTRRSAGWMNQVRFSKLSELSE